MVNETNQLVQTPNEVPALSDRMKMPLYDDPVKQIATQDNLPADTSSSSAAAEVEEKYIQKLEARKAKEGLISIPKKEVKEGKQSYKYPDAWSDKAKKAFDSLPLNVQNIWIDTLGYAERWYLKKEKEMKSKLQEKIGAEYAQNYEPAIKFLEKILPYAEDINKSGRRVDDYIIGLIEADRMFTAAPAQTLLKIMSIHNITWEMLQAAYPIVQQQLNADIANASIYKKIDNLEKKLETPVYSRAAYTPQQPATQAALPAQESPEQIQDQMITHLLAYYSQRDENDEPKYPNALNLLPEIYAVLMERITDDEDEAYKLVMDMRKTKMPQNALKGLPSSAQSAIEDMSSLPATTNEHTLRKQALRKRAEELEKEYKIANMDI